MTMEWLRDAACRGVDPELFFPLDERRPEMVAPARRVCAACPVRESCLAWALDAGMDDGVFGGLTSAERREFRRLVPRPDRTPVAWPA